VPLAKANSAPTMSKTFLMGSAAKSGKLSGARSSFKSYEFLLRKRLTRCNFFEAPMWMVFLEELVGMRTLASSFAYLLICIDWANTGKFTSSFRTHIIIGCQQDLKPDLWVRKQVR